MPAPSDNAVSKFLFKKNSFSPVSLCYTAASLNSDLQERMQFILLNLIILGMINTFHMCKK